MTNPYQSPEQYDTNLSEPIAWSDTMRFRFAGGWLIFAGIIFLAAINVIISPANFEEADWTGTGFVVIGLLVFLRIRLVAFLFEVLGITMVLLTFVFLVFKLFGLDSNGSVMLTYGKLEFQEPTTFQFFIHFVIVLITFVPPLWWLRKVEPRAMRKTRGLKITID